MSKEKLYPNHRIFELNLSTGVINEVVERYENEIGSAKIVRKGGCLYVASLNAKNADKKFHKLLNKKYKK